MRIIGNEQTIKAAQAAAPGDRSVYVNWDLISELPDQFEAVVTAIDINISKDFTDVGNGTYMPTTQLMYRIAEACGIDGGEKSIVEPIIEEVDINPLLMKGLEDAPTMRKMTVGRRVSKYSTRLQEDGTVLRSSVCTVEYNVFERCLEAWTKEEMYTEGYTKSGKFPAKYNSALKRKFHFQSELKFAQAKAETKAHVKTIRELAGLVTGYKAADLAGGRLIFSRVRRSKEILQAEAAARLSAMSQGIEKVLDSSPLLIEEPKPEPVKITPVPEPAPVLNREKAIEKIKFYSENNLVNPDLSPRAEKLLDWLFSTKEPMAHPTHWQAAVNLLEEIEKDIPEEGRL